MEMTREETVEQLRALEGGLFEQTGGCVPVCIDKAISYLLYDGELLRPNVNGFTSNKYQELASRTINKNLKPEQMELHALHGMSGEVGEIHSLYQKVYQGHIMDDEHLQKEVGDLLWFVAELCTVRGWFMSDIMNKNIDKLRARFPEGFEADKSLHRKEGDI